MSTSTYSNSTGVLSGPGDTCQTSWNRYWSDLGVYQMGYATLTPEILTTAIKPASTYIEVPTETDPATTETYTETLVIGNIIRTITRDIQTLFSEVKTTATQTFVTTSTEYGITSMPSPSTPPCSPPINSAACSASWNAWSSSVGCYEPWWSPWGNYCSVTTDQPSCQQAPIDASECEFSRSSYLIPSIGFGLSISGYDPHLSIATGCALGCWTCQVSAATVQVLYWPSAHATTQVPGNISTIPPALYTIIDSTTLTSPTVYLAYTNIQARDFCTTIGPSYASGIVAIDENDLTVIYDVGSNITRESEPGAGPYLTSTTLAFADLVKMQTLNSTHFFLSLPPQITNVDPAWASADCHGYSLGA